MCGVLRLRRSQPGEWGAFNGLIIKRLMKFVFSGRAARGAGLGGATCRDWQSAPPDNTPPSTEKLQRKSFIAREREWNEELCRPLSGLFPTQNSHLFYFYFNSSRCLLAACAANLNLYACRTWRVLVFDNAQLKRTLEAKTRLRCEICLARV